MQGAGSGTESMLMQKANMTSLFVLGRSCNFCTVDCLDIDVVCLDFAADIYIIVHNVTAEKEVSVLLKRQVQQAVSVAGCQI